jgi:hypothetical protein
MIESHETYRSRCEACGRLSLCRVCNLSPAVADRIVAAMLAEAERPASRVQRPPATAAELMLCATCSYGARVAERLAREAVSS